jgi:subtilase family serine protease
VRRHSFFFFPVFLAVLLFLFHDKSLAQGLNGPPDRIGSAIDDQSTVQLSGNRHPLARREFETGPAPADYRMERMLLVLETDPAQQRELEAFVEAQHDPGSPEYHRWLTPESFAERFGVSPGDIRQVTDWLSAHGFVVEEIPGGSRSVLFSGTAAQVESAFHTQIHTYNVGGELHHANGSDPQIPAALAGVVNGVATLHDFRRAPMHSRVQAAPEYTSGSTHYLTPGDFATIYDVAPLYSSGIDGTGQTLAIVGRTNIQMSDVQTFRSLFGLASNNPTVVVNGANPGIISTDEEAEADLDVEWSGAVAPHAAVKLVVSASTSSTDGVDLSAQYIVSNNLAAVMSTSFGSCEASMGASERAFYSNLWQQAAAQGITAMIACGDSGAAGCDSPSENTASGGLAVNGLCSSAYSVCVGGSELNESGNPGLYWSAANSATYNSALSYIPEVAWNESGSDGGSGLWAGGGGASAYYAKPSWQTGPGIPADGKRDVPDVSLSAAGHDGYLVLILGSVYVVSGTSAASPTFAGLMALVDQKTAARQGNANTVFYALGSLQAASGAHVFHDITAGNNSVPGQVGFSAGPHYDQATGLGSADAFVLASHWNDATAPATSALSVTAAPASVQVPQGGKGSVTVTAAVSGGFSSAVALTVTGAPTGMTPAFAPANFSSPGSGASVLTVAVASSVAAGTYTLTITATGGSQTKTAQFSVQVTPPPTFTLNAGPSSVTLASGGSGSTQVTAVALNGFKSTISLVAGSLPAGVSVQFAPASISGGSGGAAMTIQTTSTAAPGSYTIKVAGTAPGLTSSPSASVTLSIGRFTVALTSAAVTVSRGQSAMTTLHTAVVNGFNASLLLAASGLPKGVTASFSPASVANPASGVSTVTFTAASSASTGTQTVTLTAASGGASQSIAVSLTVR